MASSLVGRASAENSAGASSMAAAFRETKNDVVACSFTTCSPTPGVVSQHKHYHPVNLGTREPMFDVSLWSLRKVEEHQALAKAAASAVSVPEERRLGKRKERGKGKGQGKAKAPKTKSNEISEEATGGGKGKGKGKQKVPRAAAEAFPKKSPRIGREFQAVLPPLPPLGPRPGSREDKCRKAWGALAATTSEEDKSLDLFTAQLLNEFRADISEDEILETLRAMERLGTGYPWFTSVRANLAQKVAVKAEETAAAAVAAANAAKVPSLWAKAVIAGAVSISKSAVATAACEEACTAFSSGGGAFSAGVSSSAGAGRTSGAASSSAVLSAEVSAVASSGASSSSEAADTSAA